MAIRVLLADPEEALLDAYRDFLTRAGFETETASTGPDCLAMLHQWKPDVLVLELDTPNDWGQRMLDEMSEDPELGGAGVLILSRRDRKLPTYPVRDYYVKPFPMAQLADAIRAAANRRPTSAK